MAEKKVKAEKKIVATAGAFDVLRRPIITEKAAKLSEKNGVAFEVAKDATKTLNPSSFRVCVSKTSKGLPRWR